MEDQTAITKEYLQRIYKTNPYMNLLEMELQDIGEGTAIFSMGVAAQKHGNLYGVAHGGALASLADMAMGAACATLGRRVVTLDMNLNFIKPAPANSILKATGTIIHNGKQTMVVESEIVDAEGCLLVKSRGTFYVVGAFDFTENP